MLKTVKLGDYEITRLIIGGNPFKGNSHLSNELNEEMIDYFTAENIKKTLFRCEELGINTMQVRADSHMMRLIREYRNEGGKLHWIAQTASEIHPYETNVSTTASWGAIAIYHHGTMTDSLFKAGEYDEIKRRLEVIRRTGKLTGLCSHSPRVIEYAEEHKWDVDFYMLSLYNLSKIDRVSSDMSGKPNIGEPFDEEDRELAYKTIKAINKPFLVFKVLGAGRRCQSSETVEAALTETFRNIKETDMVVVGMFPKYKDQVYENVKIVERILGNQD